jgi:hypothetical protein
MIIGADETNRRNLGVLPPPIAKRLANCTGGSTVADIRARVYARQVLMERGSEYFERQWARDDD